MYTLESVLDPMISALIAYCITACAVGIVSHFVRVPELAPFPEGPLPQQHVDEVSARVAAACDLQHIAEEAQAKAEEEAAKARGKAEALAKANANLLKRARGAEARAVALEELALPTAIELVARMGQAGAGQDDDGDGDQGKGAATTSYVPREPKKP